MASGNASGRRAIIDIHKDSVSMLNVLHEKEFTNSLNTEFTQIECLATLVKGTYYNFDMLVSASANHTVTLVDMQFEIELKSR